MFLNQIPSDEDVETVVVVVELVYLKVFYSITLFMDPLEKGGLLFLS